MLALNMVPSHVVQGLWLRIRMSVLFQCGETSTAASCDGKMTVCQWWQCGVLVIWVYAEEVSHGPGSLL